MARAIHRWEAGSDVILRGAPAVVVAHAERTDRTTPVACTIALATMELAAVSTGLGTCRAGYFWAPLLSFRPKVESLVRPEGPPSFGALMLGYPRFATNGCLCASPPLFPGGATIDPFLSMVGQLFFPLAYRSSSTFFR